jgi:DDE family transposase
VARYLSQLDTADLQEPSEALAAKTAHLREKLAKLASELQRLKALEEAMLASPDQQISLTDPDVRSMATSGRGSGVVGYNVQVAVDTEHHLIVTHEVTNTDSDRSQLANIATQAKDVLGADRLDVVADRGYFNSPEILACLQADITVTMPKPMTSGAKSDGRFGKQDFVYLPAEDVYRCPAGERLTYRYTNEEDGKALRRYWTTACSCCPSKRAARQVLNAGSHDGNTNTCSKPCSSVSIRTRRRCACVVRQLNIPSARSRCGWVQRTS